MAAGMEKRNYELNTTQMNFKNLRLLIVFYFFIVLVVETAFAIFRKGKATLIKLFKKHQTLKSIAAAFYDST